MTLNAPNISSLNLIYVITICLIISYLDAFKTEGFKYEIRNDTRLLPVDGSMLHCAGQMNQDFSAADAFQNYFNYLENGTRPEVFMAYFGITLPIQNITDYMIGLNQIITEYETKNNVYLSIQVGLWLYGFDQQVAEGQFDEQIQIMINGFKNLSHPVFLRIGYEFNGQWTKFQPDTFIAAWQRITKKIRDDEWGNKYVANVWDYTPAAENARFPYYMFYPGDEWVDWWGVNVFGPQIGLDDVAEFMELAGQRGFPIMIGESSTDNQSNPCVCTAWDDFYKGYFEFLNNKSYPIYAFCYIDWNWCDEFGAPWGDARIEKCPVGPQYQATISANDGPYFNAGDRQTVLKKLGITN